MAPRGPASRWAQQLESNPRQPAGGWSSRGATPDGQQVERAAGGQHHFVLNLTLITLVGILRGSLDPLLGVKLLNIFVWILGIASPNV